MKIRSLILSFFGVLTQLYAQNPGDCSSRQVQDSLFRIYATRAHHFGLEHPGWGQTFDTLISICPNISEAYQERGLPYILSGDFEKLFENIDKAVELEPLRWTAYRGYLHCILAKNYRKAISDFETAEKLTPNAFTMDHTFSFFLAMSYMELGDFNKAERYFLKDIQQQRRGEGKNDIHYNTLLYFGIMYYLMNEMDLAEKRLSECLQLYEQHPTANYYMGMIKKITGNNQKSLYFEKSRRYLDEGYRINEPNSGMVPYPRQVTLADLNSN